MAGCDKLEGCWSVVGTFGQRVGLVGTYFGSFISLYESLLVRFFYTMAPWMYP